MKKFLFVFLFSSLFLSCSQDPLMEVENLWKSLPVQYQGRIKPFDTLARETLKEIYGQSHYEKKSAVEILLLILMIPDLWQKTDFILVPKNLKDSLGLDINQKHFSFEELNKNQKLALQLLELQSEEDNEEELDTHFKSLKQLQTRLMLFSAIQTGYLIRVEPNPETDLWLSLSELSPPAQDQFRKLIKSYMSLLFHKVSDVFGSFPIFYPYMSLLFHKVSDEEQTESPNPKVSSLENTFKNNMIEFQSLISLSDTTKKQIRAEVLYNNLNPFTLSWIFYLLFLIAVLLLFVFKKMQWLKYSLVLVFTGFVFHNLGMFLRSYIMSRPPVSNMFETVIWVPFVALIVGFIFYLKGNRWPFIASAVLAFVCLFLTSLAPQVLDGSLQPLEAVLRSSFWLSAHVLTITMSYSFFFLAFVLGDMILIYYLFQPKKAFSFAKKMYQPLYRLIQWGVVLLTGGTVLGAVWADLAWGRFWGWDPKESWALISLLGYLGILHGKLIGWITPLKMSISVVLMFFLVIMAWYGVNFVLGAGLHSYGFGSGGWEYMLIFFLLHLILCFAVFLKKSKE